MTTPERRSVTVEGLEAAMLKPGIGLCWHDQGRQAKIARDIFAALPAEPTEPAGALEAWAIENAEELAEAARKGEPVWVWRGESYALGEDDRGPIMPPPGTDLFRPWPAPSEPRADSEGLRDEFDALGEAHVLAIEENARLRSGLKDAVRILNQGRRDYVGDHWMRTIQISERTIERLAEALPPTLRRGQPAAEQDHRAFTEDEVLGINPLFDKKGEWRE